MLQAHNLNPQANAICKRMHQTVGNVLRTLLHAQPPQDVADTNAIMHPCLAMAMHATRATVHRSLQMSPGVLVFQRDMFLDIPLIGDFIVIRVSVLSIGNDGSISWRRRVLYPAFLHDSVHDSVNDITNMTSEDHGKRMSEQMFRHCLSPRKIS